MYLGEVLHMRNMSNLSKAKKWTLWLRNEYLTSGSTEIMAWKWFSNIERSWCLHPFHRHYFSGHKFFYSSSFSAVCTINFLESISSIKTYRNWYNLYVFGSFHFIESLSLSLSSVLIMFVNKMIFLIMSSTRMFWFTWPATLLGLDFQHIFGFFSLSQILTFFSCCLSCMSTHFPSSSPGTPGQTFNRLKRDWDLFIELGKQQKVLLVHVFLSVFCFCAKHVGQVRFFGVFMPISRWQVNRDLIINILCGVLLISHMPKLWSTFKT